MPITLGTFLSFISFLLSVMLSGLCEILPQIGLSERSLNPLVSTSNALSTYLVATKSPFLTSGINIAVESFASLISLAKCLAYTRSAISLNTLPAIKPPDAGRPDFCMATIQLYFGSSEGKYPQKLTK